MGLSGAESWSGRTRRRLGDQAAPLSGLRLSPEHRDLVLGLIGPVERLEPGREIVGHDGKPPRAGMIIEGWACRQRLLPDGRRQIFDLLLPGDFIGLSPIGPLGSAWTVCLTRVDFADAGALRRRLADVPSEFETIAHAFDTLARVELGRMLDQVVRLGRHTAYERTAHLFLELHDRAAAAGLADEGRFLLPLTQEVLADALGLSVVHVNRVLQQLKRDRLIELHGGRARLLDRARLAMVSDASSGF